jgi:hypothetical protein
VSTTSQPTSFADLYTDLSNRVRITTGVSASQDQAKRFINIALQDFHLGFDYKFPWAERAAQIITQAQYSVGTCTISQGSTALTGLNTLWNTNNAFTVTNMRANGKILFSGSKTPHTISSVTTDTAAVLTNAFTEASITSQTYIYYEDEYNLATDFLRPVDMQQFSDHIQIDLIGRTEFRRRYPNNSTPGMPRVACLIDSAPNGNTTPVRRVRFYQPPSTAITIPYTYITSNLAVSATGVGSTSMVADTDEPIIPLRYRHALVFYALYQWYRDKKDDTRSDQAKGEYNDVMLRIVGDVEVGGVRPQIQPRIAGYARAAKRPWGGGGSRRYTTGNSFDRGL